MPAVRAMGGPMSRAQYRAIVCALALFAMTACAARSDYPSLTRRPGERIAGVANPVPAETAPPAPALPPSADFTARLGQLVAQARAAHGRFAQRQGPAERTISGGGGAATGSEAWAVASVALAGLESARSEAMIALAELDGIYAAEAVAAAESGNAARRDAASAAWSQVNGWVAAEDAVLDRLRARIR